MADSAREVIKWRVARTWYEPLPTTGDVAYQPPFQDGRGMTIMAKVDYLDTEAEADAFALRLRTVLTWLPRWGQSPQVDGPTQVKVVAAD